jgi:hypothetical protein
MKTIDSILEQLVENHLQEAAIPVASLARQGLALMINGDNNRRQYILWDTDEYFDEVKMYPNEDDFKPLKIVIGYIKTKKDPSCDYWHVETSAAEKGYGPAIYDIVMNDIYPEGLTSDRSMVSDAARNVWNYMLKNRAHEIDHAHVGEDNWNCRMAGSENEDSRNYVFRMKSYTRPDVSQLVTNNERALQRTQNANHVRSHVGILASKSFSSRYSYE